MPTVCERNFNSIFRRPKKRTKFLLIQRTGGERMRKMSEIFADNVQILKEKKRRTMDNIWIYILLFHFLRKRTRKIENQIKFKSSFHFFFQTKIWSTKKMLQIRFEFQMCETIIFFFGSRCWKCETFLSVKVS